LIQLNRYSNSQSRSRCALVLLRGAVEAERLLSGLRFGMTVSRFFSAPRPGEAKHWNAWSATKHMTAGSCDGPARLPIAMGNRPRIGTLLAPQASRPPPLQDTPFFGFSLADRLGRRKVGVRLVARAANEQNAQQSMSDIGHSW